MSQLHLRLRIFGRVQGVFYRQSTQQKARDLGLAGFVRNEPDGSVYLEAEGEAAAVEQLAEWCRQGPELASVTRVERETGEVKGYVGFEVRS